MSWHSTGGWYYDKDPFSWALEHLNKLHYFTSSKGKNEFLDYVEERGMVC